MTRRSTRPRRTQSRHGKRRVAERRTEHVAARAADRQSLADASERDAQFTQQRRQIRPEQVAPGLDVEWLARHVHAISLEKVTPRRLVESELVGGVGRSRL